MENQGDVSPSEREALAKEFRDLEEIRTREAKSRAVVLEILGDIPDADITPPKNVLFVCKLNPVTEEDDLKIIFSRFGTVNKCDIIKDYVTGDSLQYAFVEFETEESCNEAYFKMQNVLIDDRRIHVDFCQSVSGFWKKYYYKESFTRKKQNRMENRKTNYKHRRDDYDKYSDRKYRESNYRNNHSDSGRDYHSHLSHHSSHSHEHRHHHRRSSDTSTREVRETRETKESKEDSRYRHSRTRTRSRSRDRHRDKSRHERKHRHRRSHSRSSDRSYSRKQYRRSRSRSSSSDKYRRSRHS